MEGCELHGVIYQVTLEDFHKVQTTELGGGKRLGYFPHKLEVETYSGEKMQA